MKRNNKKKFKKNTNSINKLSLFQKNEGKFSKKCPLSVKNAPIVDYKNIGLLKKYVSENGKIVSSKITWFLLINRENLLERLKELRYWDYYKMEVILLENILNLGNIGDKVSVKNGYGRNFLLKQGKALRFNKENLNYVTKKKMN